MKTLILLTVLLSWQHSVSSFMFRHTRNSNERERAGSTNVKYLTRALFQVGDISPRDGLLTGEEVYDFFHLVIGFNQDKAMNISRQLFRIGNRNSSPYLNIEDTYKALKQIADDLRR